MLIQPKEVVIPRKVIHSQENIPIQEISDDDLSVYVGQDYPTVNIDISYEDLMTYIIEITGVFSERDLVDLVENILSEAEHQRFMINKKVTVE
ncbi:MAG: hypothetical protein QM483_13730 [Desulfuromusa sp.]